MADSPLIKKLSIKPGFRMVVINPPEGYEALLGPLPEDVDFRKKASGPMDFVHVFAQDSRELEKHLRRALRVLEYDGIFWISYPKKSSGIKTDLSRDILRKRMEKHGLKAVMAVSIDAVWSAMRFRPRELVKSK
jgi:hypothetical protein